MKGNFDNRRFVSLGLSLFLIFIALVGCVKACNSWFGVHDDHPVEEMAEDWIEDQVGIDIDLSGE